MITLIIIIYCKVCMKYLLCEGKISTKLLGSLFIITINLLVVLFLDIDKYLNQNIVKFNIINN